MKSLTIAAAFVGLLGLATTAQAQTIPNPTNPTPNFPIATDGSPLPYHGAAVESGLPTGRSAYVSGPFNAVVGTGLGVADTAVGAGLGTAEGVVNGATGAIGVR